MKQWRVALPALTLALLPLLATCRIGSTGSPGTTEAPGTTQTTVPGTGSLHVTVRGPDGQPVAGAKVVSNSQPEAQLKVTGITAKDGAVTFNDIKAGQYEFYVSGTDFEQADFTVVVPTEQTKEFIIALLRRPPPSAGSPP